MLLETFIYYRRLTNSVGSVTSQIATLTVWAPPILTSQPPSRTNLAGTSTRLPLRLLVRLHADGSLDPSLTAPARECESVNTVLALPDGKILIGRQSCINSTGPKVGFVARLNSDGSRDDTFQAPLLEQTLTNRDRIAGATSSNLVISAVQTNDAGSYAVAVSNPHPLPDGGGPDRRRPG